MREEQGQVTVPLPSQPPAPLLSPCIDLNYQALRGTMNGDPQGL